MQQQSDISDTLEPSDFDFHLAELALEGVHAVELMPPIKQATPKKPAPHAPSAISYFGDPEQLARMRPHFAPYIYSIPRRGEPAREPNFIMRAFNNFLEWYETTDFYIRRH